LGYLAVVDYTRLNDLVCEIKRMLNAFAQTIKAPTDR
jgi:hypothetical protein